MDLSNVDLKQTINLPKTSFSMKANLPQAEPKLLERWEKENLYGADSRRPRRPPAYTSSTTARPTPTAASTSAPRSTRSSRISSSSPRPWPASIRPTCPVGIATACPSKSRSIANSARKKAQMTAVADPRRLPQIRREVRRPAAQGFQAPRRLRPLGRSVSHDERRVPVASSPAPSSTFSIAATSIKV